MPAAGRMSRQQARKLLEHGLLQSATHHGAVTRLGAAWFAGCGCRKIVRGKRDKRGKSVHRASPATPRKQSITQLLMVTWVGLGAANLDVAGNMVQLSVQQPFAVG
jgi:hypothetical protein